MATARKRRPRVLVLGAGSAPGISALKALAGRGYELLAGAHSPYMPGLYLVDRSYVLPRAGADGFTDVVLQVARRERADVVLPVIDDELQALAGHRAAFGDTTLAIAPDDALGTCLDKWNLFEALDGVLPLPRTWLGHAAPVGTGPVVVKPRFGTAGEGVAFHEAAPADLGDDVVVQELLPGSEVSVDVYVNREGTVLATVPRMRLSTELGVSSCGRTFHDEELERHAALAATSVGLRGIGNVQFKQDHSGQLRLLEINARVPGGMALTVAAGANLPDMLVREALGERVHERCDFRDLAMVRYREEVFLDPDQLKTDAIGA